jgi:peptidyl-tRNA hydrolase
MDPADYVLGSWTSQENAQLDGFLDTAASAVRTIVVDGITRAMNTFNAGSPAN